MKGLYASLIMHIDRSWVKPGVGLSRDKTTVVGEMLLHTHEVGRADACARACTLMNLAPCVHAWVHHTDAWKEEWRHVSILPATCNACS